MGFMHMQLYVPHNCTCNRVLQGSYKQLSDEYRKLESAYVQGERAKNIALRQTQEAQALNLKRQEKLKQDAEYVRTVIEMNNRLRKLH